ncbi:MAG: hypothetical protein FJ197_00555 [Gammaproteobacteria bacterium]|nr:hypothetical protein [Gammaproteobacteria bacterium]
MQREAPDSLFYREIRDFNLEFLGLLAAAREAGHGAAFGLARPTIESIARLSAAQLEAMAMTPCMLASLARERGLRVTRLAEPPVAADPRWMEDSRVFAARLLTYAWQVARRDSLHAVLCVGPAADVISPDMSYGELRALARGDLRRVEARFHEHPRFWPDLVRAARDGHAEEMRLAQLAAIPLATTDVGPPRPPRQSCDSTRTVALARDRLPCTMTRHAGARRS